MIIYLIRHGETDWNREKRYFGTTDIPLNLKGVRQGKKLRSELKEARVDRVYSSASRRAADFAALVFPEHNAGKMRGLRELNFGVFEGRTHAQLMKEQPDVYSRWIEDPNSVRIPKGEKLAAFRDRVLKAFKRICENGGETVAVVMHGGPIRIILGEVAGDKDVQRVVLGLGKVNKIEISKDMFL
jgi:alpha-ribazole phosphatase